MTNRVTTYAWIRFCHRLGQVTIATVLGLTLIALPACSDDEHHNDDGHDRADHQQMDKHMDGHDAQSMDQSSDHEHNGADDDHAH